MVLAVIYTVIQLLTWLAYMWISFVNWTLKKKWDAYAVIYANFIFWCGLHHAGCVLGWLDMPMHMAMYYDGPLGAVRAAIDFGMVVASVAAAYQDWVKLQRTKNMMMPL